MHNLQAVIFDMDGLMLDTERLAIPSLQKAGEIVGITLTEELIIEMIGLNEDAAHIFMQKRLGQSIPKEKFASAFYEDYYEQTITKNGIPLKEGLLDLIDFLEGKNIRLAVATSTKIDLAFKKLDLVGMRDRFEVIIGGDQVVQGKPAPDPYLKAVHTLGIQIDHCIALEDSENGAMSAYAAGIKVIVVPDIKPISSKTKEIAFKVCESLHEVNKYLQAGGFEFNRERGC